jgi:imidazolonepropionase-like amidohydrolase
MGVPELKTLILLGLLAPALGAQAPRDTLHWLTSFQGRVSGRMDRWVEPDGTEAWFIEYNDRGRGPRTLTKVSLDRRGWATAIAVDGHDYRKNPVQQRWSMPEGRAPLAFGMNWLDSWIWQPLLGRAIGRASGAGVPVAAGSDSTASTATARSVERLRVRSDAGLTEEISLVAVSWGGSTRARLWLDQRGELFGIVGWQSVVRAGWQAALPAMIAAEERLAAARMAETAARLLVRPAEFVAVTGVSLVDVRSGEVRPGSTILVRDSLIVATGSDGSVPIPAGARRIDGAGKWALPGLWEMHGHLGALNDSYSRSRMAGGVLASRDLVGTLPAVHSIHRRREAIRAGREVGLTFVISGFMDGPAENAGPTSVLVATEDSARSAVRSYAAMGYDQIKIYSSLDPRLVPAIVDEARKHRMRVSGHIPAFMTVEQAVRAGVSEVNHANMLMLNFFGDTIDTRGTDRFYIPMERWPEVDIASSRVQDFIRLLKDRDIVLDPTLCIFKAQWGTQGGFPVRPGYTAEHYRQGYQRMQDLVMAIYRGGVRMVAGTDNSCSVQDELAIYGSAGIPVPELLRMATLGAAEVAGRGGMLGSIEPGKLADLILVDADPMANIQNTRRVSWVLKGGIPLTRAQLAGSTDWP